MEQTNIIFTKEDWISYFTSIFQINNTFSSTPPFYKKFIDTGIKHNYFNDDLLNKIKQFDKKFGQAIISNICNEWANNFHNDFNLKDHFFIFHLINLSSSPTANEKGMKFLESKINDKKEFFHLLTRFFLDDDNASIYSQELKTWSNLLEKHKFPINALAVKHIIQAIPLPQKHYNTNDLFRSFKYLVLGHLYNPNPEILTAYVSDYSKDNLFYKKAIKYLELNKINIPIKSQEISLIKNQSILYIFQLESEYFVQKHSFSRKNAEKITEGFLEYIKIIYPKANSVDGYYYKLSIPCSDIVEYQNIKTNTENKISKLDNFVSFYQNNKIFETSKEEIGKIFNTHINKIDLMMDLENDLGSKDNTQKKLKL